MVWLHVSAWGLTPKSAFPPGVRDPHLTQCVTGPHKCTCQMGSKSVERLSREHECDRQTDHAMKQCVGIGGIACTARNDSA